MRTLFCTILAALLLLAFFNGSCGNSRSPTGPASATDATSAVEPDAAIVERPDPFTEEDRMVMAMPLSERIAYLEKKLKDLLFEHYGIVIEEDVSASKKASLDDPFHKVCVYVDEPNPKENLQLVQTENKWEWTLSFLERLSGDYNFDHVVTIADITPISMYFNASHEDLDWMDGPYHVDRLGTDDGVIHISEITPLAMHYGMMIKGYNVYWQRGEGDERLIADWRDSATPRAAPLRALPCEVGWDFYQERHL